MINVKDMQVSLIFKWIYKLQSEGKGVWRSIPTYFYNKFGTNFCVFNSNVHFNEFRGLDKNIPDYYIKLLAYFLDNNVLKTSFSDHPRFFSNFQHSFLFKK